MGTFTEMHKRILASVGLLGVYETCSLFLAGRFWASNESLVFLLFTVAGLVAFAAYWTYFLVARKFAVAAGVPVANSVAGPAPVQTSGPQGRVARITGLEPRSTYLIFNLSGEPSLFRHVPPKPDYKIKDDGRSGSFHRFEVTGKPEKAIFLEAAATEIVTGATAFVAAIRQPWWARGWNRLFGTSIGGVSPLRAAIVVCSPEVAFKKGAKELGGSLRAALQRLGEQTGLIIPVYVVIQAVPYPGSSEAGGGIPTFHQWALREPSESRQNVFGVTFSAPSDNPPDPPGSIKDLLSRLAEHRPEVLSAEPELTSRCKMWEYPRDWRRREPMVAEMIAAMATVDHKLVAHTGGCLLRGVYFAGTTAPSIDLSGDSRLCNEESSYETVHLDRLIRDVLLKDKLRAFPSTSGHRIRQISFAVLLATLSIVLLLAIRSWWKSGSVCGEVVERYAEQVQRNGMGTVSKESIRSLTELRRCLVRIENSPDWWPDLWLGPSAKLKRSIRQAYFAGFRSLFLDDSVEFLKQSLAGGSFVRSPFEDYRMYRMLHEAKCRVVPSVVESGLRTRHRARFSVPLEEKESGEHFNFYSVELAAGRIPFQLSADEDLLAKAAAALASGTDAASVWRQIQQNLESQPRARLVELLTVLSEQEEFRKDFDKAVDGPIEAAATFTATGRNRFNQLTGSMTNPRQDQDCAPPVANVGNLAMEEVRKLFRLGAQEFWRGYLAAIRLKNFDYSKPADAADRLRILAKNRSPLFGPLVFVAENTRGDAVIEQLFDPVHKVTGHRGNWSNKRTTEYGQALTEIASRLSDLALDPKNAGTRAQVSAAVSSADQVVNAIVREFGNGTEGVDNIVARLLRQPIEQSRPFAREPDPAANINGAMSAFCGGWNLVRSKLPFNLTSEKSASLDEIAKLIKAPDGELWKLLRPGVLERPDQGEWRKAADAGDVELSQSVPLFLRRMEEISRQFYPEEPRSYQVGVQAEGFTNIQIEIDGTNLSGSGPHKFTWPGNPDLRIQLVAGNTPISSEGPWALHRAMAGRLSGNKITFSKVVATGGRATPVPLLREVDRLPGEVSLILTGFPVNLSTPPCPAVAARKR